MNYYVGVSAVQRDPTIASSMIVQDYIATHFRDEKPIAQRYKPKGMDSCFGNFPPKYKRPDPWDGNSTQRRRPRSSYGSRNESPAKTRLNDASKGIPQVIRSGGASRPVSASYCRRSSRLHNIGLALPTEVQAATTTANLRAGVRPKSAPAMRRRPGSHLQTSTRGKYFSTGFRGQREEERIGSWPKECTPSMAEASEETESRPNSAGGATSLLWERDRAKREQAGKDLPDREEMEAMRSYLLKKGKFLVTPSKLMASLEVARATNSRPLSAPAFTRRRRLPAPPKAGAWRRRPIAATLFRKYYVRGDLPICVDHRANRNGIRWKIRPADLDFHVYLPIFFDGVREASWYTVEDPFRFLAVQGTLDMIEGAPEKVLPVIPQLILPIKTALNTREPRIICPVLKVLQQMILLSPMVGEALVPYYRQILPVLNLFRGKNNNIGDSIDYNQRSRVNIGVLVMETLEVMEQFGGPDAFINIKYMIPTYESCGP
ncbi:unnamed protein product [Ascophyllum nodosum]